MNPKSQLETKVTIYDVAQAAGCSPSTVSRTFSKPGRVSARTAKHVHQVAREIGYEYEPQTPLPAKTSSNLMLVSVPDISNPVYAGIVRGIQVELMDRDMAMILVDSHEDVKVEKQSYAITKSHFDCAILIAPRLPNSAIVQIAKLSPTIVVNRIVPGIACIVPDTSSAIEQILTHLISLGHRHVLYVSGPESSWIDGIRWRALTEASKTTGISVERTAHYSPSIKGGSKAANDIASSKATAILAYNDLMAVGLCEGLNKAGIKVGSQRSLISFDNIFISSLAHPPLTTVGVAPTTLGRLAALNLFKIAQRGNTVTKQVTQVPTELIVRHSTAKALK